MDKEFITKEELPNRLVPIRIGPWETHNLDVEIVLPKAIQNQAVETVIRWAEVFPKEPTWVQDRFGIPSLIVRIDGTVVEDNLAIYEIEDRPAGIGHSQLLNPQFRDKLAELRKTWPDFDVAISPLRDPADDQLWSRVLDFAMVEGSDGLVYVRAEPEEEQFWAFQARSVSTIATEGDKSYGVPLGLWRFIDNPKELPEHQCFVLKPLQSSKARNMAFYDVYSRRQGHMRMKNVIKVLQGQINQRGGMFIQDLIPPMESGIEGYPFMIYRFFLGFDLAAQRWVSLGGSYFARNNLKIHGASDSLSGPLNTG